MERDNQASEVWYYPPAREERGDRNRRDRMLSFCGTILSFSIPVILLIGVIWNPAGVEGDAMMALLVVLASIRLGIALARMRTFRRRDRISGTGYPTSKFSQSSAWARRNIRGTFEVE
jgi:hypothetical protein